jgi:ASC-1-like (ASCH) protein
MIHEMRLHAEPFAKMQSGTKTTELRINDDKRQLLHVGDIIVFTNRANTHETLTTKVSYLKTYPTFRDLFMSVKHLYPEWEEDAFVKSMYAYYSPEDELKYGALEIGIALVTEGQA